MLPAATECLQLTLPRAARHTLGWIVGDMPRPLTGVEIGFLGAVAAAAQVGGAEAVREQEAYRAYQAAAYRTKVIKTKRLARLHAPRSVIAAAGTNPPPRQSRGWPPCPSQLSCLP